MVFCSFFFSAQNGISHHVKATFDHRSSNLARELKNWTQFSTTKKCIKLLAQQNTIFCHLQVRIHGLVVHSGVSDPDRNFVGFGIGI